MQSVHQSWHVLGVARLEAVSCGQRHWRHWALFLTLSNACGHTGLSSPGGRGGGRWVDAQRGSVTGSTGRGAVGASFMSPRASLCVMSDKCLYCPSSALFFAFAHAVLCPVCLSPPLRTYSAFIENLRYVRCDSGTRGTKTPSLIAHSGRDMPTIAGSRVWDTWANRAGQGRHQERPRSVGRDVCLGFCLAHSPSTPSQAAALV